MSPSRLTRKDFLAAVASVTGAALLPNMSSASQAAPDLTVDDLKAAQKVMGLSFTEDELTKLLPDVKAALRSFIAERAQPIPYDIEPPTVFVPLSNRPIQGKPGATVKMSGTKVARPAVAEEFATMSVRQLAELVRQRKVSSLELTELSLRRLQQYGDKLLCVVTLMADEARAAAKAADADIAAGHYRGPLHGIPCGVKDLFATRGVPTTWGAEPYKNQVFDYDSALVEKLHAAGAVICAKLSMGALANGDFWFRGRTKNPWNTSQGSSGSSAGSASAVSACLLPFAIGTETLGSICSPSNQCRVTGLRPTYGRVSRYGAMAVSWTMDKIGPICREVEDCALVFAAIQGADHRDRSSVDKPFHYDPKIDLSRLKIGYFVTSKDSLKDTTIPEKTDYLVTLRKLGANLQPVNFTPPQFSVLNVLEVEGAAAFDDITRSGEINKIENSPWPVGYRGNRFVPGVEYLQFQRMRTMMMRRFEQEFGDLDMFVASGIGGYTLQITNMTGHPQVLVPYGTLAQGPRSVSFVGRIYEEAPLLAVARMLQESTDFHKKHPDLSKL